MNMLTIQNLSFKEYIRESEPDKRDKQYATRDRFKFCVNSKKTDIG